MSSERLDPTYWTHERTAELLGVHNWPSVAATYQNIAAEAQESDPYYPLGEFWNFPNPRTVYGSPPAEVARQRDQLLPDAAPPDLLEKGPNEECVHDYVKTVFAAKRIQRYLEVLQKDPPECETPRPGRGVGVYVYLPHKTYRVRVWDDTPLASRADESEVHIPFSERHQGRAQDAIIRLVLKHSQRNANQRHEEDQAAARRFLGTLGVIGTPPKNERRSDEQGRARVNAILGYAY
jgi:hypothetical protein